MAPSVGFSCGNLLKQSLKSVRKISTKTPSSSSTDKPVTLSSSTGKKKRQYMHACCRRLNIPKLKFLPPSSQSDKIENLYTFKHILTKLPSSSGTVKIDPSKHQAKYTSVAYANKLKKSDVPSTQKGENKVM